MKPAVLFLVLSAAVAAVTLGDAVGVDVDCLKGRYQFKRYRWYEFNYETITQNAIEGTSDVIPRTKLTARLSIQHLTGCQYVMEVTKARLYDSLSNTSVFSVSPRSGELAAAMEAHKLRFMLKDGGLVKSIEPASDDTNVRVLNMKRGMISALQVNIYNKENIATKERDVSGDCEVVYPKKGRKGQRKFRKVKNLASCQSRTAVHSNIEGVSYGKGVSLTASTSSCAYAFNRRGDLRKVHCEEKILLKPFSSQDKSGAYVRTHLNISLVRVTSINPRGIFSYQGFRTESLLFEHDHTGKTPGASFVARTRSLLKVLAEKSYDVNLPETAVQFADLVSTLRNLDSSGLGQIVMEYGDCEASRRCDKGRGEGYRSFLFSAMAQCGSTDCVMTLVGLVVKGLVPTDDVDALLTPIAFTQEPTEKMIQTIMGLHQQTKRSSALLLLGTLVHKYCKHSPEACTNSPGNDAINMVDSYLVQLIGSSCMDTTSEQSFQIFAALKAIGNAGRPATAIPMLLSCARQAEFVNVSIAAIQATRRMEKKPVVMDVMREMMTDKNVDVERRMQAFFSLMQNPMNGDIQLIADMVNDNRESGQLRSLMFSHLQSIRNSKDPSQKQLTERVGRILSSRQLVDLQLPASRFSKAVELSGYVDFLEIGGSVKGVLLFHPESYVPRSVGVNLTTFVLGEAVNALEVDVRAEGLETLLYKWFGPGGAVSQESIQKMFTIPDKLSSGNNRGKRSAENGYHFEDFDNEVNIKESSPQATLSIKVFGNEVQLFTLADFPLLTGRMDEINIIDKLYQLTKGSEVTMKKNILFLEANQVIPTIGGLAMKLNLNGSSVVTAHVTGKVESHNLFFGPKSVTLKGSIEPSATITLSGNIEVDSVYTTIGTQLIATTFTSTKLSGQISYEENKELKIKIDVDKKPSDILIFKYNMFHSVRDEQTPIIGSPKRASLKTCSSELMDPGAGIGVDLCAEVSMPVSSHDMDAPYFPLTGPANLGISLSPSDESLTYYELIIKKKNDMYRVTFDTPGSQYDRHTTVNLGVTVRRDRGVIGATFGKSEKGLTVEYRINNATNGIEALLSSNLTTSPMTLSMDYFNHTDPHTLDRQMVAKFHFHMRNYNIYQTVGYEDRYNYWAIRSSASYAPGKTLHVDFEGHYQPQFMLLTLLHVPTKTRADLRIHPSYPFTAVTLNATHGDNGLNVNSSCEWHMEKTDIKCQYRKMPGKQSASGYVRWLQLANGQAFNVMMSHNDMHAVWNASYTNRGNRGKLVTTNITIPQHSLAFALDINRTDFYTKTVFDGQLIDIHGNIDLKKSKKTIKIESTALNHTAGVMASFNALSTNEYEFCFGGSYDMQHVNACVGARSDNNKKSISLIAASLGSRVHSDFVFTPGQSVTAVVKHNDALFCDTGIELHRAARQVVVRLDVPSRSISSRVTAGVVTKPTSKHIDLFYTNRFDAVSSASLALDFIYEPRKHAIDARYTLMGKPAYSWSVALTNHSTQQGTHHRVVMSAAEGGNDKSYTWTGQLLRNSRVFNVTGDIQLPGHPIQLGISYDRETSQFVFNVSPLLISGRLLPSPSLSLALNQHNAGLRCVKLNDAWAIDVNIMNRAYLTTHNTLSKTTAFVFTLPQGTRVEAIVSFPTPKAANVNVLLGNEGTWERYNVVNITFGKGVGEAEMDFNYGKIREAVKYLERKHENVTFVVKAFLENELRKGLHVMGVPTMQIDTILLLFKGVNYETFPDDFSQSIATLTKSVFTVLSPTFDRLIRSNIVVQLQQLRSLVSSQDAKVMASARTEVLNFIDSTIQLVQQTSFVTESSIEKLLGGMVDIGGKIYTHRLLLNSADELLTFLNLTQFEIPVIRNSELHKRTVEINVEKFASNFQHEVTKMIDIFFEEYITLKKPNVAKAQELIISYLDKYTGNMTRLLTGVASSKSIDTVVGIFQRVLDALRHWNYDEDESLLSNVNSLALQLKIDDVSDSFVASLLEEVIEKQVKRLNLPAQVHAMRQVLSTKNITAILVKAMELSLDALNVTADYRQIINQQLETKDLKSFLRNLALVVVGRSQANAQLKEKFTSYLRHENTKALIKDLYFYAVEIAPIPDKIKVELRSAFLTRNITGLIREITFYGLSHVQLSPVVKTLLMDFIVKEDYKGFVEDVAMHYIDTTAEIPEEVKALLRLLLRGDQKVGDVAKMLYEVARARAANYATAVEVFATLDRFVFTHNVTAFTLDLMSVGERVGMSYLNVSSRGDALKMLHGKVKASTEMFITLGLEKIPLEWRSTFDGVVSQLRVVLDGVTAAELVNNWHATVSRVVDETMNVVQPFVAQVVTKKIIDSLHSLAKGYFEQAKIGNETAKALFDRSRLIIEDRMLFLIRVLSQFLPSEMQLFAQTYMRSGKLDYLSVYKDAMSADYLSKDTVKRMVSLVTSLSDTSMKKLVAFSGSFQFKHTAMNIIKLIKTLNYTDVNIILNHLVDIDWQEYTNVSYPALLKHSAELLRSIGARDYRGQPINIYLGNILASAGIYTGDALMAYEKFNLLANKQFQVVMAEFEKYKTESDGFFQKMAQSMNYMIAKSNKYQRFLLDVTMPMAGGALARLQTLSTSNGKPGIMQVQNAIASVRAFDKWNVTSPWLGLIPDLQEINPHMTVVDMLQYADELAGKFQNVAGKEISTLRLHWGRADAEIKSQMANLRTFLESSRNDPLDVVAEKVMSRLIKFYEHIQTYDIFRGKRCTFAPVYYIKPALENATRITSDWVMRYLGKDAESIVAASVPYLFKNATDYVSSGLIEVMSALSTIQSNLVSVEYLRDPKKFVDSIPALVSQNLDQQLTKFRVILKKTIDKLQILVETYKSLALGKGKMAQVVLQKNVNEMFAALQNYSGFSLNPAIVYAKLESYSQLVKQYIANYTSQAAVLSETWLERANKMLLQAEGMMEKYSNQMQLKNRLATWEIQWANLTRQSELRAKDYRSKLTVYGSTTIQNSLRKLDGYMSLAKDKYAMYTVLYKQKLIDGIILLKNKATIFLTALPDNLKAGSEKARVNYKTWRSSASQNITTWASTVDAAVRAIKANSTNYVELVKRYLKFNNESFVLTVYIPVTGVDVDFWLLSEKLTTSTMERYGKLVSQFNQLMDMKFEENAMNLAMSSYSAAVNQALVKCETTIASLDAATVFAAAHSKVLESMVKAERVFTAAVFAYQSHADNALRDVIYTIMHAYKVRVQSVLRTADNEGGIETNVGSLPPIPKLDGFWSMARNIFKPLTRTALFFGQHVFTFDGTYAHIPDRKQCTYLLARDFRSGLFTILYSSGIVTVEFKDSRILMSRDGKVEVQALAPIGGRVIVVSTSKELPVQLSNTSVVLYHDVVQIQNAYGVSINCQLQNLFCNVTVAGFYHNKTLGILGTNNVEYSDDLRMPNGRIATDMIEFVNAWEVTRRPECRISGPSDYLPSCRVAAGHECRRLFKNTMSPFKSAFHRVNTLPFMTACEFETSKCSNTARLSHCDSAKAYINVARRYNVALTMPAECARCNDVTAQEANIGDRRVHNIRRMPKTTDIVLIIKQAKEMRKIMPTLRDLVRRLDKHLQYNSVDRRFAVVAFGGAAIRSNPHVQTGNGRVFGSVSDLLASLDALRFDGDASTPASLGLSGIRHAAHLTLRPLASKIFFVFDNDVTYNGDLQLMGDVGELLKENGITLNAFNQYHFKKSVIGKDMDNTRYHMKIPKGERLGYIEMPPTDDYLTLVRSSRGTVLTIKGLMSPDGKWMKAMPIALGQVIDKQIARTTGQCQICQCQVDYEGRGVTVCEGNANAQC